LGHWPNPPIPNPQSPIPNPHPHILNKILFFKLIYYQKIFILNKIKLNNLYYLYLREMVGLFFLIHFFIENLLIEKKIRQKNETK
jgi:hypothetical protein